MKLSGIIAEYNPFHNGHAHHIRQTKLQSGCDAVMVVMSGSCVQRGAFAVADKWTRAKIAVENGADLVCELPFVYAAQTAECFAAGGVALLDAAQCETITFGMENKRQGTRDEGQKDASISFENLQAIAAILADEPSIFQAALKQYLSEGCSFAHSRQQALSDCGINADVLSTPNNILAVEYLKALKKQKSRMIPVTIPRQGEGHHSDNIDRFSSASAIRHAIKSDHLEAIRNALPYSTEIFDPNILQCADQNLETLLLSELLKSTPESLREIAGINEGLEFALLNAIKSNDSLSGIIDSVSSKRIPKSRIRRILMHLALHYTKNDFESLSKPALPYYLRVLAFNEKGKAALRQIKQNTELAIITNLHSNRTQLNAQAFSALKWDCLSTDLYYLLRNEKKQLRADYHRHPVAVD